MLKNDSERNDSKKSQKHNIHIDDWDKLDKNLKTEIDEEKIETSK